MLIIGMGTKTENNYSLIFHENICRPLIWQPRKKEKQMKAKLSRQKEI